MRGVVEAAEGDDGDACFLGEVADEEVGFGGLCGGDGFALEAVDAADVRADDDTVGATGEADLGEDDDAELATVDGEGVDGGGGCGHLAGVQRRPGFLLAEGDADFEAVFLEEVGIFRGSESAVCGDEAGVACVFAKLDVDGVVLRHVGG